MRTDNREMGLASAAHPLQTEGLVSGRDYKRKLEALEAESDEINGKKRPAGIPGEPMSMLEYEKARP
jgi:hypothetical protein